MRNEPMLPVGPLQRHVEARGGIHRCFPHTVIVPYTRTSGGSHDLYHLCDYTWRRTLTRSYQRAVRRGTISVSAADRLCIEVLGLQPELVWGDEFWNVECEPC